MENSNNDIFYRQQCNSREEWLENRKDGIGGSSCAAILGNHPRFSNVDYYEIKTGLKEPKQEDNDLINYGIKAEDPIREIFKLDYKGLLSVYHSDYELLIRKDKPYIRASLDGELEVLQDFELCGKQLKKGMKGIWECKTKKLMRKSDLLQWDGDNIPLHYHYQRLHYLLTTDYDFHILRVDFNVWNQKLDFPKHWTKDYLILNEEVDNQLDFLESKETYFWEENILKKKRPNRIIA